MNQPEGLRSSDGGSTVSLLGGNVLAVQIGEEAFDPVDHERGA